GGRTSAAPARAAARTATGRAAPAGPDTPDDGTWLGPLLRPRIALPRPPGTGAAEPGEDLSPDRGVPGAERAPAGRRVGAERAAPQHLVLGAEEHLGVLPVRERLEPRIAVEVGVHPLPDVPDQLVYAQRGGAGRVRPDRGRAQVPLPQVGVVRA